MSKTKKYKKDAYAIKYTKEDIKEVVERSEATILDRKTLIKLVEDKMQAQKSLLLAESAVSNYCIAGWKYTINECRKQIKKVKAKVK